MPASGDGTFTDAQMVHLQGLQADFKAFIMKDFKGDKSVAEKLAKKWKDKHTPTILTTFKKDYPYPSTWVRDTTDSKVKGYIRRYFGNYLQGTLVRTGLLQPGVEQTNNAIFTTPRPLTARKLYEQEEKDEVLTFADELKSQEQGGNAVGTYQTALKELWDQKDEDFKAKYEKSAREGSIGVDIAWNQRDFEAKIGGTLQDLCTNGALGPAEALLFTSFRNSETGEISTLVVHGHSDENQCSFADFLPNFTSVRTQWDRFSTEVLPSFSLQDRTSWDTIPRNAAGIPIFPAIDLDNTTRSGLAQIAELYLRVLWDHTWPSDEIHRGLPFAELAQQPDLFYDTHAFSFKPTFGTLVKDMTLSELSGMVEYMIKISTTDFPFVFRDKQSILALQSKDPLPQEDGDVNPKTAVSPSSSPPPRPPEDEGVVVPLALSPPATPSRRKEVQGSGAPSSSPPPLSPLRAEGSTTPPPPPLSPLCAEGADAPPPPPPPPPRRSTEPEDDLTPPKKGSKRKAKQQLVPEAEGEEQRPSRRRQTPAEAAEERQRIASEAAKRTGAKPRRVFLLCYYSWTYKEKSLVKKAAGARKRRQLNHGLTAGLNPSVHAVERASLLEVVPGDAERRDAERAEMAAGGADDDEQDDDDDAGGGDDADEDRMVGDDEGSVGGEEDEEED
ncbi:hypothetical protein C8R44DRAFT_727124 [Mycena epipterygia]|nr:hypothetical protein C8R44DRAFT_727124 [Mycena epipterygia]